MAWGNSDPLWAVATWAGKQRGSASAWTDAEFYGLGAADWRDFFSQWTQYGVDPSSCIEIGCGAGRMTAQLAQVFRDVYACDVSEGMIRYAQDHLTADNIRFIITPGRTLPIRDGQLTAAFSTHVFQHFDSPEIGYRYFEEIYRVLRPGGTVMIHLPILAWPAARVVFGTIHSLLSRLSDLRAALSRILIARGRNVRLMRGTIYPIGDLRDKLTAIGFSGVELRVVWPRSNGAMHPFVLATK